MSEEVEETPQLLKERTSQDLKDWLSVPEAAAALLHPEENRHSVSRLQGSKEASRQGSEG